MKSVRVLFGMFAATLAVVVVVVACGDNRPPSCSGYPDDPEFQGWDAWVPSTTDPKCCAPVHNQFIVPSDAAADATCMVEMGQPFLDDAGVGDTFPIGTRVNLTYCNGSYEGRPQDCFCSPNPDAAPTWACGL